MNNTVVHTDTVHHPSVADTRAQPQRVTLFGEMLADRFPDRDVLGGAPFNVACHLRAFGLDPLLVTRLGNDPLQARMLDALRRNDMQTAGIQQDDAHPTGQVQVRIEHGEPHFDILPQQAYDFITANELPAEANSPALLYFGTLAQRHPVSAQALQSLLAHTRARKFLDINLRAPWYDETTLRHSLQQADIVKINDHELSVLTRMFALTQYPEVSQPHQLIQRFDLQRLIVTRGAQGAWLFDRDGRRLEAAPASEAITMVDTVGAGDGFAAVCILGTLLDWPPAVMLERANRFAAAICGLRGAVPEQADFYSPFRSAWQS